MSLNGMTPDINQEKMELVRSKGLSWYCVWRCIPSEACVDRIMHYVKPDLTDECKAYIGLSLNVLHRKFKSLDSAVKVVQFSSDGTKLAGGSLNGVVKLWDLQTGKCCNKFKAGKEVVSLALNSKNTQLAGGLRDGTVMLWDLQNNTSKSFKEHVDAVLCVKFSRSDSSLFSGSHQTLKLWSLKTDEHATASSARARGFLYSHDNKYAAWGTCSNNIRLYNFEIEKDIVLQGHSKRVFLLAFSQDSKRLISGDYDGKFNIWDLQSGLCIESFRNFDVSWPRALSSDGKLISGAALNLITMQTVDELRATRSWHGHKTFVSSLNFSPDGNYLASGSKAGTIRVWNIKKVSDLVAKFDATDDLSLEELTFVIKNMEKEKVAEIPQKSFWDNFFSLYI
jgi:WD40 repeat protein